MLPINLQLLDHAPEKYTVPFTSQKSVCQRRGFTKCFDVAKRVQLVLQTVRSGLQGELQKFKNLQPLTK